MTRIPTKILIAYDGSSCAKAAMEDLRHAGLGFKIKAKVISVSDPWVPPIESLSVATDVMFAGAYAMTLGQARNTLKEVKALAVEGAAHLRKIFPEWDISTATAMDSPAQGILHVAEKWKPGLIVMGSQGHTALGGFLLGSVSHKVLTHAVCNVRIARLSSGRDLAPRILLAVDGSKDAEAMLKGVANRVWVNGAEFRVVVVLDYRLSLIQNFPQRIAEQAESILAERGLKVTAALRDGDPREEIIREVKRFKASSHFVGSRGLHAVQRFFLGSVSAALAERAPCAVEVVRR